jgi:hypothetical protein
MGIKAEKMKALMKKIHQGVKNSLIQPKREEIIAVEKTCKTVRKRIRLKRTP